MEENKMVRDNKNKVQMSTVVDTRTGMVMCVVTRDCIVDLRPYGATFDNSPMNYDGPDWDND